MWATASTQLISITFAIVMLASSASTRGSHFVNMKITEFDMSVWYRKSVRIGICLKILLIQALWFRVGHLRGSDNRHWSVQQLVSKSCCTLPLCCKLQQHSQQEIKFRWDWAIPSLLILCSGRWSALVGTLSELHAVCKYMKVWLHEPLPWTVMWILRKWKSFPPSVCLYTSSLC